MLFAFAAQLERILEEMVDVLTLSCGLTLCSNLTKGENLLGRSIRDNIDFFQDLFEVRAFVVVPCLRLTVALRSLRPAVSSIVLRLPRRSGGATRS